MSKGDEIDELVSSVRNFVAHKDSARMAPKPSQDKLFLTPDSRLTDEQVKAIDAEWAAELRALEAAGIVAPGEALAMSETELEAAIAQLPVDWQAETAEAPESATGATPAEPLTRHEVATAQPDPDDLERIVAAKISEMIDYEALQALVVQTVHEELGGELGERITRNVRKLVRREINRVMTSRDLSGD